MRNQPSGGNVRFCLSPLMKKPQPFNGLFKGHAVWKALNVIVKEFFYCAHVVLAYRDCPRLFYPAHCLFNLLPIPRLQRARIDQHAAVLDARENRRLVCA